MFGARLFPSPIHDSIQETVSRPMEVLPYPHYSLKITILQRFEFCIIESWLKYGLVRVVCQSWLCGCVSWESVTVLCKGISRLILLITLVCLLGSGRPADCKSVHLYDGLDVTPFISETCFTDLGHSKNFQLWLLRKVLILWATYISII